MVFGIEINVTRDNKGVVRDSKGRIKHESYPRTKGDILIFEDTAALVRKKLRLK